MAICRCCNTAHSDSAAAVDDSELAIAYSSIRRRGPRPGLMTLMPMDGVYQVGAKKGPVVLGYSMAVGK